MQASLETTTALLSRTPAALDGLLRGLPDSWILGNEGGTSWNAFTIVGHLAHAERTNWMPRVRTLLEAGDRKSFEPFARTSHQADDAGKSMEQLLDEFATLRQNSLSELAALFLRPEALSKRGHHPAVGTVTLSELLSTWALHDLTHLHQLSRVLAHQYREAVGPWSVFLGVLQCNGHSQGG